ncbi:MAG: hypothetical protein GY834_09155 [Bacteroidetes bacterium]|nr:hypothetical protein [Bacteroidota bacterium]
MAKSNKVIPVIKKADLVCDDNFEIKVNSSLQFVNEQEEKDIFGGYFSKNLIRSY